MVQRREHALLMAVAISHVVVLASAASASPVSEDAPLGPRAMALGEALRGAATGSLATSLNPAGIGLTRAYVIEGILAATPGADAKAAAVSICDSVTARVGACIYYDFFRNEPSSGKRRTHEAGIALALPFSESFHVGITQKYVHLTGPEGEGGKKGYLLDAGLVMRAGSMLNLALVGYNLVGSDERYYPLGVGGGISVFPGAKWMISADGQWDLDGETGRYGAGLEYFVASSSEQGIPLRLGVIYDEKGSATHVTGGVGFVTSRVALDLAARRQVDGGSDFSLQVGLRMFLPNS
ncbi:MAG: hypothetical protein HY698_08980 [Deltaproteobacteria bacterium]|nr:hypothetical protein [Deltaproteobacteria bacterium]